MPRRGRTKSTRAGQPPTPTNRAWQTFVPVILALAAGVAVGWVARDSRATTATPTVKRDPSSASSAVAAAPAGPCADWAQAVCGGVGESAEGCAQAKSAAELLPESACTAARADLEGTVARLKAARGACDTLIEKLCADLGKETQTCAMVREKTGSFPADRCKQMLSGYEGVLGELKEMERGNAPISEELAARQAAGEPPGFGPKDAKVVVVAYSDFECHYCARAAEVATKLREKHGDKVRFVFRQFPLGMHENAPLAAEAALAAHAQGKFWPYHDLLFENQRSLDRTSLERYAEKTQLDMAKFKNALDEHTYAAAVKSDMKLGEEVGVSGTPTMFLGTERVANPTDFDALSRQIEAKLASK